MWASRALFNWAQKCRFYSSNTTSKAPPKAGKAKLPEYTTQEFVQVWEQEKQTGFKRALMPALVTMMFCVYYIRKKVETERLSSQASKLPEPAVLLLVSPSLFYLVRHLSQELRLLTRLIREKVRTLESQKVEGAAVVDPKEQRQLIRKTAEEVLHLVRVTVKEQGALTEDKDIEKLIDTVKGKQEYLRLTQKTVEAVVEPK